MLPRVMDPDRLDTVRRSALLDSARESQFDELTRAAALVLDAPYAFMTAVDETRSFWKSAYGIEGGDRQARVEDSFCQYVIEQQHELLFDDTSTHPMTRDNPTVESEGYLAWAGCPVRLDGQILGTFCVIDEKPRVWTQEDREALRSLTSLAEREISLRADLHIVGEERDAAEQSSDLLRSLLDTLRSSLLPPSLPDIAGVDMAAWSRPATDGHMLLGDFYDVFRTSPDQWGIAVGDVCGHGVEAAKMTSLVRYTLRSAAIHHADLSDVLAEVDRAVRSDTMSDGRFATLCYLALKVGEAVQVKIGRCGHPYPILRSGDGTARLLDTSFGSPLGAIGNATFDAGSHILTEGETLLIYTDGVIERRHRDSDELFGEDGLLRIVSEAPVEADPAELVDHVIGRLDELCGAPTDDTVLLALRPSPT